MSSLAGLANEDTIKQLATPADFTAGQHIADNGGVTFVELSPVRVSAHVTDPSTEPHDTLLETAQSGLHWHCTCSSNKALFCKHLVATALETAHKSPRIT